MVNNMFPLTHNDKVHNIINNHFYAIVMAYLHCWTRTLIPVWEQLSIPKMRTTAIGDVSPDRDQKLSLCNVNMFCVVQCSHQLWNPNLSRYPNPCLAV